MAQNKRPRLYHDTTLTIKPIPDEVAAACFNFQTQRDQDRWLTFQQSTIHNGGKILWSDLEDKGWKRLVQRALSSAGLYKLFKVVDEAYDWPTKEVLTTFDYTPTQDPKEPDVISYQCGGVLRKHSLDSFGVSLGLYTEEDLAGDHGLEIFTSGCRIP
ncbi:hypothetical protein LINGRAHAP2_LOCUS8266, partial [Linum grandiflorum]